jgi:HlyD family secretion protein
MDRNKSTSAHASDFRLAVVEADDPAMDGGGFGSTETQAMVMEYDETDFRPSIWRRLFPGALVVGALLLAGVGYYYYWPAAAGGAGASPTVEARRGAIHRVVAGKGKIEPRAELRLTAPVMGRIKAILVAEGADVKRGDVLVQMDDEHVRAQLSQALALLDEARARRADLTAGARPQELESARARERESGAVLVEAAAALDRARTMFERGIIPRAQVEEAERRHGVALAQNQNARQQLSLLESGARDDVLQAALAQVRRAEAEVQLARAQLAQTTVRAPVSGRIIQRFMNPGEVIVLQRPQPILTLADLSRIQVRAEVDEGEARFLTAGQPAAITVAAFPGRTFKGTVVEIGRTAGRKTLTSEDPSEMVDTKVVETIIELTDAHPWTFGVTVEVSVVVEHRENVLVVPRSAVREENGQMSVMIQSGQSFSRQPIRVAAADDDHYEVVAGLKEGDVVLRNQ